jgi:hypothetical protein
MSAPTTSSWCYRASSRRTAGLRCDLLGCHNVDGLGGSRTTYSAVWTIDAAHKGVERGAACAHEVWCFVHIAVDVNDTGWWRHQLFGTLRSQQRACPCLLPLLAWSWQDLYKQQQHCPVPLMILRAALHRWWLLASLACSNDAVSASVAGLYAETSGDAESCYVQLVGPFHSASLTYLQMLGTTQLWDSVANVLRQELSCQH